MRSAVGKTRGQKNTTLIMILIPYRSILPAHPAGDKFILANAVILIRYRCPMGIIRIGIYNMDRGRTEIGFENDLAPKKFRISTYQVEIKRI